MRQSLKLGLPAAALLLAAAAAVAGGQGNSLAAILSGIAAGAALIGAAIAHAPLLGGVVGGALAAGVSVYLTVQHHAVTDGAESVCNIDATFNCDAVNSSTYSELFGVPIALLGAAFYVAVALFSWMGWRGREGYEGAGSLLTAAGAFATAYSLFLASASASLGAWCLFCVSTYIANALLLVSGVLARRERPDAPGVFAAVMGKGASGERYILGGQNMRYPEIMDLIAEVGGVRGPRFVVPRFVANIAGACGDVMEWAFGGERSINSTTVAWGYADNFLFSSEKARRELGYTTGPLERAIEDAIAWFRVRGML